jgi:hypothetical protein
MGKGAIAIGIIFIIFGISLILITNLNLVGLIYGVIAIILGIALMAFWKEEGKIEERKDLNKKKRK